MLEFILIKQFSFHKHSKSIFLLLQNTNNWFLVSTEKSGFFT